MVENHFKPRRPVVNKFNKQANLKLIFKNALMPRSDNNNGA